MNATPRTTKAERAGRWLGHAWRGLARQEARAIQWLAGKGLPAGVARLLTEVGFYCGILRAGDSRRW